MQITYFSNKTHPLLLRPLAVHRRRRRTSRIQLLCSKLQCQVPCKTPPRAERIVRFSGKTKALSDEREAVVDEDLFEDYTTEMQEKMEDTSLVYCHEKGMNYARLTPDIIIGSCLQTPTDVDTYLLYYPFLEYVFWRSFRLVENEGVTTILCLQENVNLDYFSVDITAIEERCEERGDVRHIRCPIRDFDPMDLRLQLPKVVALICQQHFPEEGETLYIHCTAGECPLKRSCFSGVSRIGSGTCRCFGVYVLVSGLDAGSGEWSFAKGPSLWSETAGNTASDVWFGLWREPQQIQTTSHCDTICKCHGNFNSSTFVSHSILYF